MFTACASLLDMIESRSLTSNVSTMGSIPGRNLHIGGLMLLAFPRKHFIHVHLYTMLLILPRELILYRNLYNTWHTYIRKALHVADVYHGLRACDFA